MSSVQRLPARARTVIRLNRAVWLFVSLVIIAAGVTNAIVLSPVFGGVVIAFGALTIGLWWWWTGAVYRSVRWQVDADTVQLWSGVVMRSHSVLPRARVQNVTRTSGPIQRWKGLATLIVHSAGAHTPDVVIPHLDQGDADSIRAALLPAESEPNDGG